MRYPWEKIIRHEQLNTFRVIRGLTREEVDQKAAMQMQVWNERWRKIDEAQNNRSRLADSKLRANLLTKEAEEKLSEAKTILITTLTAAKPLDWEELKDKSPFSKPKPQVPAQHAIPVEPKRTDAQFSIPNFPIKLGILDYLIPPLKKKVLAKAEANRKAWEADANYRFERAHEGWISDSTSIKDSNESAQTVHEKAKAAWLLEKHTYNKTQEKFNESIDELKQQYFSKGPQAVERYCSEILARCHLPDSFPRDSKLMYNVDTRLLALDFELPQQGAIPKKKQVKYIATRSEFQESFISDTEFKHLYDDVLYQICLSTLHELFARDEINAIDAIAFNGWAHSIDRATGANTHPCIMTVQVTKAEFMALNLSQVELKACFRSLKGISGSKLIDLLPVAPVLTLNTDDPRFVTPYAVADALNDKTNLAAMDWLDFENLIRELFEKVFSQNGGQVKITQASRDGGVDAIAFDPDPIRGGKIVIQAKRYTNTVGVNAVRDLFGTVHNEGATKGILVTTSDYGPDAYEFVKGKPLTLLSGGELLGLLQQHGYHAKIDIAEAKKLLGENQE